MGLRRFFNSLLRIGVKDSPLLSWQSTGKPQQTLASAIEKSGTTLHSGLDSIVKLLPAMAGEGRYFVCRGGGGDDTTKIPASIRFVTDTRLCTTLGTPHHRVRTVEHLLSALEATGVDNCRIEITSDEVPLLDGSAREWVEAIAKVGFSVAKDANGEKVEKLAPFLQKPLHVSTNDSFIAAFPSKEVQFTCGINFPHVPAIGCQWFSSVSNDNFSYVRDIAPSRTFCIHEEVERMYSAGFIRGGSTENAIVCSASNGWLNPPLRFQNEPCRHKVLDLIGDFSLLAQNGNQGLPVAHIIAYKGGHSLHAKFARCLSESF